MRKQQDEPTQPAEAKDAEVCAEVDAIIGQNPEPPAEELGNASMIAPQGKVLVAAKARKKQTKTLKNASVRGCFWKALGWFWGVFLHYFWEVFETC